MSRVVLMCGPAGAGKSTVARRLEAEGMARLSFDQEAWRRGIRTMPLPPELHAEIEGELRARLLDLVQHGADVVLDFSFWSRRARMEYRELLQPYGVVPETIYLATPRAVALDRMRARGLTHPDDYALPEEVAAAYFDHFETPTADEGPLTVVGAAPRTRGSSSETRHRGTRVGIRHLRDHCHLGGEPTILASGPSPLPPRSCCH